MDDPVNGLGPVEPTPQAAGTPPATPPEPTGHKHPVAVARKHKARKRLVIITIILLAAFAIYWFFYRFSVLPFQQVVSLGSSVGNSVLSEVQNNFSAPPPLHAPKPATQSKSFTLTDEGVITDTNQQRSENGNLPPLAENPVLDDIAMLRLDDMFAKQYFAHVSPYGSSSAVTVAATVGYDYINLGENLALGNFVGDSGVVTAWMNSPGHRANILDTDYTQIGVAVRNGTFQGQNVWIAVQVFGRPASACPAPDEALNATINTDQTQISQTEAQLQADKSTIDNMQPQYGSAYNAAVSNYNMEVDQYNELVGQTKADITEYNAEVEAYNQCLGPTATDTVGTTTASIATTTASSTATSTN